MRHTVLITGSEGFMGRNLREAVGRRDDARITGFDLNHDPADLPGLLSEADIVFHLAGVNRPRHVEEFQAGNAGLTRTIVDCLLEQGKNIPLVISSSIQAALDNPYGISKREAENAVLDYGGRSGAPVYLYRLTNVFGKWSRPNYNSVVSTFCHNIAHGLDIAISDPAREVELVYIDDVVAAFLDILDGKVPPSHGFLSVAPTYRITLGNLAEQVGEIRDVRTTLQVPDLADDFTRKLHATYVSYLDGDDFSYSLETRTDNRGCLAELIKSRHFGQIFVSKTNGRTVRGNHYHNTKIEKFCVLQGEAVIRLRHLFGDDLLEYRVSGDRLQVVDIPPGYTHSIENLSDTEMIVLFWANQIFDPEKPDTHFLPVSSQEP